MTNLHQFLVVVAEEILIQIFKTKYGS